jgi:hypothetical protein
VGNSLCLCRALSIYEFKSDRLLGLPTAEQRAQLQVSLQALLDEMREALSAIAASS